MKTSVIFTTYNSPVWLEKVLWGFFEQTHKDFEIVIADYWFGVYIEFYNDCVLHLEGAIVGV